MHLNEYMHEAMAFRLPTANADYALLNLAGEVGELLSKEAKLIRDGGKLNEHVVGVKKELGDILWCLTAIAVDYGFTLEDVAKGNIDKLANRKTNQTIQGNGDDR
jgi:NTP pyrophosphatase (non-canonical NTP hydrolase)